jgi:SagB-type dehydrogenase family enzyme
LGKKRPRKVANLLLIFILLSFLFGCSPTSKKKTVTKEKLPSLNKEVIPLPPPQKKGKMSLEETLQKRRSKRRFESREVTLKQISQLLWACQGITEPSFGGRTAPSAGALYPLEVYVVKKDGVFHYLPEKHALIRIRKGDMRKELSNAALGQTPPAKAPVSFVITAVYSRTAAKYGERAERYVKLEAGHACQNLLLEVVALDLGGVPIGAFYDEQVQEVLSLPPQHEPLYIVPIGYPR